MNLNVYVSKQSVQTDRCVMEIVSFQPRIVHTYNMAANVESTFIRIFKLFEKQSKSKRREREY